MKRTQEAFAAEVYRRSEVAIQTNKKRRRALLTTLPLAVCLMAVSALALPRLLPEGALGTAGAGTDTADGAANGIAAGAVTDNTDTYDSLTDDMVTDAPFTRSVEVQGDGKSHLCTDPAVIDWLECLLPYEAVDAALRGNGYGGALKGEAGDKSHKQQIPVYTFVLTGEDGVRYSYSLSDNTLYVENVGQSFPLAEDEAAALKRVLQTILSGE